MSTVVFPYAGDGDGDVVVQTLIERPLPVAERHLPHSVELIVGKTHRQHAIIEQVHADLKNSALAHLPSNSFPANAAWLVWAVMAFNLTRAAGTLTSDPKLTKATTGTLRRTIVSVPARIASSARRLTLHLPQNWPWETAWHNLFDTTFGHAHPIVA